MQDLYITKIDINKVRNLSGLTINLVDDERKHLIITGKNGSGKTSVLEAMRDAIIGAKKLSEQLISLHWIGGQGLDLQFNRQGFNFNVIADTMFLYIPANHNLTLNLPKSIEKVELNPHFAIGENASDDFIKYMIYLNYQRLAENETENNNGEAVKIRDWFDNFQNILREMYNCPSLELKHVPKELNFKIHMPGYEPFGLHEMADGYSAFLKIVMELIMRMDYTGSIVYDIPGIVLIDEIETHLHVELQKKVLPFLTKLFPKIQFIVSTHSPFVITSIADAVIYDLERKQRFENLSAYSYEGIIEYYFDLNMYSQRIKTLFDEYKTLLVKKERGAEENEALASCISELKQIPLAAAPELVLSFQNMEKWRRASYGKAE
jgi:predicted ATP-dependent endonuclease of OLD family